MSMPFLLAKIVADPSLHGRWLNTFSYLEYIGFRKIIKSQPAHEVSLKLLGHALEEGRHAYRFKKWALLVGGQEMARYSRHSLLCPHEAETYFQELDHICAEHLGPLFSEEIARYLNYLYVTHLVEVRALMVYRTYQEFLPSNSPVDLRGLLVEEEAHLKHVTEELQVHDPEFSSRFALLQGQETRLYDSYISALSTYLGSYTS